MVLLFLGDRRGTLNVVLAIPISILTAVLLHYAVGQTINIMTFSGVALAAKTKATFPLIDYPGKSFTATLSRNSSALDTRTKSVIAEFD